MKVWLSFILLWIMFGRVYAIDFCVTEAISNKKVLPSTIWSDLSCQSQVIVRAALGEYEPASVVIRSDQATRVNVRMGPMTSGEKTLDPESIDIRYVKAWYQSETAWKDIRQKNKQPKLVPELLLKNPGLVRVDYQSKKNELQISRSGIRSYVDISSSKNAGKRVQASLENFPVIDSSILQASDIKAGHNQQLWITFRISLDTTAGRYQGELIVDADGVESKLPVTLDVRPYRLLEPNLQYSIYYRGLLAEDNIGSISSERKSREQMLADFRNMKAHGINNPTIYQDYSDLDGFESILQMREQVGFDNSELYLLGVSTGNYTDKNDVKKRMIGIEKLKKRARDFGVESLYVYGIDEADVDKIVGQYPLWQEIRQQGDKIFAAAWRENRESALGGKVDLLVNGISHNKAVNKTFVAKGTKVYLYNRPQVGVENPRVYRDNYGLALWTNGYAGAMNYAYQDTFGTIWNDFDHKEFRDHVFAYPGIDGPIDTIAWEGFREGVDDIRYLTTLQAMIEEYRHQKTDRVKEAEQYLQWLSGKSKVSGRSARSTIDRLILSLCCAGEPAQTQIQLQQ